MPAPHLVAGACLAVALLAPFVALAAAWRAALRPCRAGGPPAFFAMAQRASWITLGAWVAWLAAAARFGPPLLATAVGPVGPLHWPLVAVLFAGPPTLAGAIAGLLVHDVARRARLSDWSPREAAADALLALGGTLGVIALVPALAAAAALGRPREAALAAVAALALAAATGTRRRRAQGLTPHAVTSGPLRDRVFALAARAGVTLRQLVVVPLRQFRLANAFAVQGNVVVLTDVLLERLDRDEVDAVLAHEMAHLARRDPRLISWLLLAAGLAACAAAAWAGPWAGLAAFPALLLGVLAALRRIEHATDARALALGARPGALVSGLLRLGQLSHVPPRWSRLRELLMTHPSTERRARRIAAAAGLAPGAFDAWLDAPPPPAAPHEMPAAIAAPRAFSSGFRQRVAARLSWAMALALAGLPAVAIAVAGTAGADRLAALAGATLVAFLGGQVVWGTVGFRALAALRGTLAARVGGRHPGFPPADARYVGLAPGDAPRVFEGFAEWDAGFLALRDGWLEYAGEETRFALEAADVRQVRLDEGLPGWLPTRAVRVRWERPDGTRGAFGLVALDAGDALAARRAARRLLEALDAWREGDDAEVRASGAGPAGVVRARGRATALEAARGATPSAGAGAAGAGTGDRGAGADVGGASAAALPGAPPTLEVTSASPREAARPQAIVAAWVLLAVLAGVAAALAGLPLHPFAPGLFDALAATFGAHLLTLAPVLAWREPRPVPAPAPAEGRRAA